VGRLSLVSGSSTPESGRKIAFLWRLMIAGPYQKSGFGKKALELLARDLRAAGHKMLYTSQGQGEGSPEGFYRALGFVPTGNHYDDEVEVVLTL
jgi:diamine N-acetyltransferase